MDPARPSDVITQTEGVSGRGEPTPEDISLSREGDPKRLRKRLLGDLDAIVLKALRKEPDRRYRSVVSFAEDLERHLEKRPILAREASAWERLTRFINTSPSFRPFRFFALICWPAPWSCRQARMFRTPYGIQPFDFPLDRYFLGYTLCVHVGGLEFLHFARVTKALPALSTRTGKRLRIGAMVGGLIWGLGITLTWRLGGGEGWWHSRIPGNSDPLRLASPPSTLIYCAFGGAVMWMLTMTGRRFGRRGTGIGLVLLGLGTALGERIAFGTIIPALAFDGSAVSFLSTAALTAAAGWLGLAVMRLIVAPNR